jgi:predicted acetyltransferase
LIGNVSLERGKPEQRGALEALAQLYIHDFTDFLGEDNLDVGEDGRFADEMTLEDYWTRADHSVWFIRAEGKLAGFVLLDRRTRSGKHVDFNMSQFFVLRAYRGKSVAQRAVELVLNRHPGQWEVAIMERNTPALRFWPRAVARARITDFEATSGVGSKPSRTLLRFVVPPGPA